MFDLLVVRLVSVLDCVSSPGGDRVLQGFEPPLAAEIRPLCVPRRGASLRPAGLRRVRLPPAHPRPGAEGPRPKLLLPALSQPRGGPLCAGTTPVDLVFSR